MRSFFCFPKKIEKCLFTFDAMKLIDFSVLVAPPKGSFSREDSLVGELLSLFLSAIVNLLNKAKEYDLLRLKL